MHKWTAAVLIVGLVGLLAQGCSDPAVAGSVDPYDVGDGIVAIDLTAKDENVEKAVFAAGCFWGVEAAFRSLDGVKSTAVGYTGGKKNEPTYRQVCSGNTGHAEAVLVEFDPEKVAYEQLLDIFWSNHNPTTKDRQGPDVGTQYRSGIFYQTPEQQALATESIKKLEESGRFSKPIVTEISPASTFWCAEDYHQQYLEKRGLSTCHVSLE